VLPKSVSLRRYGRRALNRGQNISNVDRDPIPGDGLDML